MTLFSPCSTATVWRNDPISAAVQLLTSWVTSAISVL